jgi:acyl-CoA synthetase (AMP-forming)/AMP-acid ligase II
VNAASLLTKAARAHADRAAVRCGPRSLTYGALAEAAARFGRGLRARGLVPGDRVAIVLQNGLEYPVAIFGAWKAGLAIVPINRKLHPREAAWIVENAEAAALVTDSDELDAALVVRPGADWDAVLAAGDAAHDDEEVAPDALAWLFYTSGTTGFPKGAMLSHRNVVAMTMNCLAEVCDYRPDDVVLHAAPLSHGCGAYLLPAIARGADNLIYAAPAFDGADVLATIERERVTCISFVAPTQIVRLLAAPDSFDTSSLRRLVYGGGPIHVDHAREAIARFGPVLCQIYGQGEAPMTITVLRPDEHTEDALASAGFPRIDVDVELVDGEVTVRGDVVMAGYWRNEEATARALRGGWLFTGDVGRFDERGRLFLLDRKNDMIVSGGANIYPREVEDVLVEHPAVSEVCVFGVPDREWGESVVAVAVPAKGATIDADELIAFCRERLASYKKPRRVEVVDALPKNAYGKVLRRELRDRVT